MCLDARWREFVVVEALVGEALEKEIAEQRRHVEVARQQRENEWEERHQGYRLQGPLPIHHRRIQKKLA